MKKSFKTGRLHLPLLIMKGFILIAGLVGGVLFVGNNVNAYFSNPASTCAGTTQVPVTECITLLNLYNATHGDQRTYKTNWGNRTNVCSWFGVFCTPSGSPRHVQQLVLRSNNLVGYVPLLTGLSSLEYFHLDDNQLTGIVDNAFSGLSSLQNIDLSWNQLTSVPSLTGLSQLTDIDLNDNQLTSMPAVAGLSNLERLVLYNNLITTIPDNAFDGLSWVWNLDIHNNQLTSIPSLTGLSTLLALYLYDNQLTSLPGLGELSYLKRIDVHNNQITSIPSLAGFADLETVDLSYNQITTFQNNTFFGLSNLTSLAINNNLLTTLPDSLTGPSSLASIDVVHNCIDTGTVLPDVLDFVNTIYGNNTWQTASQGGYRCPARTFSCANVSDVPTAECEALLDLYNTTSGLGRTTQTNWLGGGDETPNTVCDRYGLSCTQTSPGVFQIHAIGLSNNNLSGILPSSIADLSAIEYIYLNGNQLTSISSNAFAGLSSLLGIHLDNNQLTNIPDNTFSDLSNLSDLSLDNNQLTSISNATFSGLSSISTLNLDNNQITNIPNNAFDGMPNLTQLSLNNNQLTAIANDAFFGVSNLTHLSLNNNQLPTLPETLISLTNLSYIVPDYNKICIGSMSSSLLNFINSLMTEYWQSTQDTSACIPQSLGCGTLGNGEACISLEVGQGIFSCSEYPISVDFGSSITQNSDALLINDSRTSGFICRDMAAQWITPMTAQSTNLTGSSQAIIPSSNITWNPSGSITQVAGNCSALSLGAGGLLDQTVEIITKLGTTTCDFTYAPDGMSINIPAYTPVENYTALMVITNPTY